VSQESDSPGVNWGNVALAAIALALLLGGGGFVLWNERRLVTGWDKTINARPELKELLPLLAQADPQNRPGHHPNTLRARQVKSELCGFTQNSCKGYHLEIKLQFTPTKKDYIKCVLAFGSNIW